MARGGENERIASATRSALKANAAEIRKSGDKERAEASKGRGTIETECAGNEQ